MPVKSAGVETADRLTIPILIGDGRPPARTKIPKKSLAGMEKYFLDHSGARYL
jgi:hypothetical protein